MGKKLSTRREKESEMKIPRTQKEQNLFNYLVDKIKLQEYDGFYIYFWKMRYDLYFGVGNFHTLRERMSINFGKLTEKP